MSDLPPIEYERTDLQEPSGLRLVHYLLMIAIVGITITFFLPSRNRHVHHQVICASNLRSIGQAIELYALDCGGVIPPDLQAVATAEDLGLDILICPKSKDHRAPSTQAVSAGGACSYLYVGSGVTSGTTNQGNPKQIAVIEDPANHALDGGNVLFADGHVEFMDLPTIQLYLNELNAGFNPPRTMTPKVSEAAARQDYEKNWKARMLQLKTGVWRIPSTQTMTQPEADGATER